MTIVYVDDTCLGHVRIYDAHLQFCTSAISTYNLPRPLTTPAVLDPKVGVMYGMAIYTLQ